MRACGRRLVLCTGENAGAGKAANCNTPKDDYAATSPPLWLPYACGRRAIAARSLFRRKTASP